MEMEHQAIVSNCGGKLSEHNSIYTCGSQNLKEAGAVAYCFSKDKLLSKLKADTLLAIACFQFSDRNNGTMLYNGKAAGGALEKVRKEQLHWGKQTS